MKKKLIILSLIIITALCGFSQNCGYMGKRVLFNADVSVSPAWRNYSFLGKPNYYTFNYIFSPNIEVIAWKKGTAGVVGHFFKTKYNYEIKKYYEYEDSYYTDMSDEPEDLTTYGTGIFYKQYLGQTNAPFGLYFKFELDYFIYNYTPNEDASIDHVMACKVEFGKDWLLMNRLHISLGGSFGTAFGGLQATLHDFGIFEIFGISGEYQPQNIWAKGRIDGAYWFGIKVGVGILAF